MTILKSSFSKNKPKKLATGVAKTLIQISFMINHIILFSNLIIDIWDKFDKVFLEILNKHAPLKRKLFRANYASYVSKAMRKAIMKRSSMEKKVLKKRTEKSWRTYKKRKKLL